MKIKVCGITSLEQMKQLQKIGVDYAGMIFYKGSKRFVGEKMENETVKIKNLKIDKVGVFVNANATTIKDAIEGYGLSAVQLHGGETQEFCFELMNSVEVIKVFSIAGGESIDEMIAPFQNSCNYFLFDTLPHLTSPTGRNNTQPSLKKDANNLSAPSTRKVSSSDLPPLGEPKGPYGGSGRKFNWKVLENARINKPFFLSGGIALEDMERIKAFDHPDLYAVDINSRFEIEPGVKDMKKIQSFAQSFNHG